MAGNLDIAAEIEAGLREAIAHRRGEIALETRIVEPMPPARDREIRKSVAKSTMSRGQIQ